MRASRLGGKMLRRLGIQKRIMAYVTIGLVCMFGITFLLVNRAIQQSTDLVFQERLAIAQSVATALSLDNDHVGRDAQEEMAALHAGDDGETAERVLRDALFHLARVDYFSFFTVQSLWLVGTDGRIMSAMPGDSLGATNSGDAADLARAASSGTEAKVLWPEGAPAGRFVSVGVPLRDSTGNVWAWVLVNTLARNASQPFVPFQPVSSEDGRQDLPAGELPQQVQYHLEILTASGSTALGIGPDEHVGGQSWHYPLIKSAMETGTAAVLLHEGNAATGGKAHVMAVVPVPKSGLFLVLEQDKDVALALPIDLRRRLFLFGGIGFLVTLAVAWTTTRHVAKPTERLTAEGPSAWRKETSPPRSGSARRTK